MQASVREGKARLAHPPQILIVDDEPDVLESLRDLVVRNLGCRVVVASSLKEARQRISQDSIEIAMIDLNLPDGQGTTLLPALRELRPCSIAMVITGQPSLDGAVSALREGATDYLLKPFSNQQMVERVQKAIQRHGDLVKREQRVSRLREAVRRLNDSRKLISKKVDLLCNDLIGAYSELSKQLDVIRNEEAFRKHIAKADDLEQLLCHSMDWMLRQIGYCNVAVYLAADDGAFQLGAYMKYTISGELAVTDALRRVIVPQTIKNGLVRVRGTELADRMTTNEVEHFKNQDLLAVNCTYLGESLASLVFFRDERTPFVDEDQEMLKQVAPIFAVELASIVRDASGQTPFDEADFDGNTKEPEDKNRRKPKQDPADWWKRGEQPPF